MKNIKTFTLGELQQLQENNYDTIREAIVGAAVTLAEQTGFMALDLVALSEGTSLWATPEGRFLQAEVGVTPDEVVFENIVLLELDDQDAAEGRRDSWGELVDALAANDPDRANALFDELRESTIYRIKGHKVTHHRYNPRLGMAMKRARSRHRASYMVAAHKVSTKIKRARTFRRNKIAGLHRQLQVVSASYDALDTALGGVKQLLPEWKSFVTIEPLVESVADLDQLFAQRRFQVKSGVLTESRCKRGCKKTTLADVAKKAAEEDGEDGKKKWVPFWALQGKKKKAIKEAREQLANEHRRVSFRDKIEAIRHQSALNNMTEAQSLVRELAIENPNLLYLKLEELAAQISTVFEAAGKRGHALDMARDIYRELRVQNKTRVATIVETSVPLFEDDEAVPDDIDDAFVVVTDRLYTAIDESESTVKGSYQALREALDAVVAGLREETDGYAADDVNKIAADELIAVFEEHSQSLAQAVDKSYQFEAEKLAEMIDDINVVLHDDDPAGRALRDEIGGELSEAAGNDEIEAMIESEGRVYTFEDAQLDEGCEVGSEGPHALDKEVPVGTTPTTPPELEGSPDSQRFEKAPETKPSKVNYPQGATNIPPTGGTATKELKSVPAAVPGKTYIGSTVPKDLGPIGGQKLTKENTVLGVAPKPSMGLAGSTTAPKAAPAAATAKPEDEAKPAVAKKPVVAPASTPAPGVYTK